MTFDHVSTRSRAVVVLVVLLVSVVLAGCSALPGAGGGDQPRASAPEGTITPVPVPTDTPTPTPSLDDVPGFSGVTVEDGAALLDAHTDRLRNRSFTVRFGIETVFDNGTVVDDGTTTVRVGNDSRIFGRAEPRMTNTASRSNRTLVATESWIGDNGSFAASVYADAPTTYVRIPPERATSRTELASSYLLRIESLTANNSRVVGVVATNDTRLYRVEARTNLSHRDGNVTVRALVDPRGRIHEYRATGLGVASNLTQRITVRYTDVGSTSVERPAWYDDAVASAQTPRPPRLPRATDRQAGVSLPPGISGTGVTDPSMLVDAHAAALDSTSFTYRYTRTERNTNGTLRSQRTRSGRFGANEDHYYAASNVSFGSNSNSSIGQELWTNGGRIFVATATPNGTEYRVLRRLNDPSVDRPDRSSALGFDPTMTDSLRALLDSMNLSVADGRESGTYRLSGTVRDPSEAVVLERSPRSIQNVSLTAVVDATGLVRRYRLEYTSRSTDGDLLRATRTLEYTEVGSTAVGRPPWYRAAVENTRSTS